MLMLRAALVAGLVALVVTIPAAVADGGKVTATVSQTGTQAKLALKNTGTTTIKYVVFSPAGGKVAAMPKANGGSVSEGTGYWNGLNLAPGQTVKLTFTASGTITGGKVMVNDHVGNDGLSGPTTVTKGGGTTTPPPKPQPVPTADVQLAVLGVAHIADENGRPGLRFKLTVHNAGPATAHRVSVGGVGALDRVDSHWDPGTYFDLEPGKTRVVVGKYFYSAKLIGKKESIEVSATAEERDPNLANNKAKASATVERV